MKILIISEYFYPFVKGGGEINSFQRAKKLIKEGNEVHILTSRFKKSKEEEILEGIIIHRLLSSGFDPSRLLSNLRRIFIFNHSIKKGLTVLNNKGIMFDKVYLTGRSINSSRYFSSPNAIVESLFYFCPKSDRLFFKGNREGITCPHKCTFIKFLKCQKRSRYIGKMKNRWFFRYNLFFLLSIWVSYKRSFSCLERCEIITISKFMKRLISSFNLRSSIEPNFFNKKMFENLNPVNDFKKKKSDTIKITALGSLVEYRGFQILLEAAKGLNFRIEIYGSGEMKNELQDIIDRNKLNAEIKEPVPYNKVPEILFKTDYVVVPSIFPEPEGRVAVEAKLAGKKLIVSKIGALEDIKESILFEPNNVKSLRLVLEKISKD